MTVPERKLKLIEKIAAMDNPVLLDELIKFIEINPDEPVYIFSQEQKKAIAIAEEQRSRGEYLSHEEAQKQAQEWLK